MKNKFKIFLSFYLILTIFVLSSFNFFKRDVVLELFKELKVSPSNFGIKLVIYGHIKNYDYYLKYLGINNSNLYNVQNQDNIIKFNSKYTKGYIEYLSEEESVNVIIDSTDYNSYIEIENKIFKYVSSNKSCKYYRYYKGRDLELAKGRISKVIDKLQGDNISLNNIKNGWSLVFRVKNSIDNNYIIDNGKKINYQLAYMRYKSGNYLIVGSPIIQTTY